MAKTNPTAPDAASPNLPDTTLVARIYSAMETMPEGERRIADFVLSHQTSVGTISQADLARPIAQLRALPNMLRPGGGVSTF